MTDNRTEGTKHELKGSLKEAGAKATDDKSGELEGKLEKNFGQAQRKFGQETD